MTLDAVLILSAQGLTALAALAAFVSSLRNRARLDSITVNIDGRMEKLLELAGARGENVGRAAERADVARELATADAVKSGAPTP